MSFKVHSFKGAFATGQANEERVARRLSEDFEVERATDRPLQRRGIDLLLRPKGRKAGPHITVEVKSDARAEKTGNAFIEDWSVKEKGIFGWVHTCEADVLAYLCLPARLLLIETRELKEAFAVWRRRHPRKPVRNAAYTTEGILVPLRELAQICRREVVLE